MVNDYQEVAERMGRLAARVLRLAGIRKKNNSARGKGEVLSAIYGSILSSDSIDESIKATLSAFRQHFTFNRISITLFDFERCIFVHYGTTDTRSSVIEGEPHPLEKFPSLHILLQHQSFLVQDISKKRNPSDLEQSLLEKSGIHSYFLCPLVAKGELLGSLNFGSDQAYAFSIETVSFFQEVATGIAISIHQYNLQEKIRLINNTLERNEKNITDSINYAHRIQVAKLPSREQIRSCVPDCFVLYKPKDIVSGDFYYFRKQKGAVFVASADCTGHGVPGALMSMLCSENLDDAVSLSADTSVILSQLNKKVKHSLQQSDHLASTRDGMDIALCSIDQGNHLVKFAGANRPIWIMRKDGSAIEEIQGTKKSIGGFTSDGQEFNTHWIKFKPGDTFYLTTDGYSDTFGGKKNKKLMTRRFKEILAGIKEKSMLEQERYLDDFIENWKGGQEQVDDILVIGVRM
jgi:serine phosphatase RsbU (regulator of sigma subunit)